MHLPCILAAVVALLIAAPANATGVRPPGATGPLGNERLSNERTVTRWAHPLFVAPILRAPSTAAPGAGRLRMFTEDGEPEVYLALASRVDGGGRTWLQIRIPGRPNGRTGWTLARNLDVLRVVRTQLRIDRARQRATLLRRGRVIWRARIGVGQPATPTPAGRFYVRERLRNLAGDPLYGPWAFGTSAYSRLSDWPGGGVVGIHGTNQPWLLPGQVSHGCVRVRNDAIRRLSRLMPIGTPIAIV